MRLRARCQAFFLGDPLYLLRGVILVSALMLSGCASSFVRVTSNPEGADIHLIRTNSPPLKIGSTPLAITPEAYPEAFTDNIQLAVSKNGFNTESIIVPKSGFQSHAKLHFNLREPSPSGACAGTDKTFEEIAQGVAESQRQLLKKNTPEAKRLLTGMISKFPGVATFHNLLGNAFYLERDINSALESYRRARDLQPSNYDTIRMIDKLQNMRGGGN